jgi:C-terminal processing protease CtpA/Prc
MLESRIGYVRIPLMARGIVADVRAKIDGLIGQGARGVVVDLRNVGGGSEAPPMC